MPVENNFQHDELSRKNPGERLAVTELTVGAPPDSPEWLEAMAGHGRALSHSGVRTILFLHGALHGTDVFGAQRRRTGHDLGRRPRRVAGDLDQA